VDWTSGVAPQMFRRLLSIVSTSSCALVQPLPQKRGRIRAPLKRSATWAMSASDGRTTSRLVTRACGTASVGMEFAATFPGSAITETHRLLMAYCMARCAARRMSEEAETNAVNNRRSQRHRTGRRIWADLNTASREGGLALGRRLVSVADGSGNPWGTHISELGDTESREPDRTSIRTPVALTTNTRWAENSLQQ
jgi:hypothetical protein